MYYRSKNVTIPLQERNHAALVNYIQDVTERQKGNTLRKNEQKYRKYYENVTKANLTLPELGILFRIMSLAHQEQLYNLKIPVRNLCTRGELSHNVRFLLRQLDKSLDGISIKLYMYKRVLYANIEISREFPI